VQSLLTYNQLQQCIRQARVLDMVKLVAEDCRWGMRRCMVYVITMLFLQPKY
jgi:hypothetical protein